MIVGDCAPEFWLVHNLMNARVIRLFVGGRGHKTCKFFRYIYLITHMKRMHISETIGKSAILHGNDFQIGWNKSKLSRKGHRKWNPSPVYRLRRGDGCQWGLCGDAFNWLHDTTFAKHAMTMNGNNVTYLQRFSSMIASFSCWIKCHYSCKIVLNSYQNRNTSTVVVVGVRRGCVRCSWSQVSRLVL